MGAADVTAIETLAGQLRALGVKPGDALMAHVAMRDLVPVERGAAGVLAALREVVGGKGTLLFALPCEATGSVFQADDRFRVATKLAHASGFDPALGRARGMLGDFPNAVLADRGMRLAPHPAMRYAAWGRRAAKLLDEMPEHDPMGIGSPIDRFVAAHGKVLVLGADPWLVTAAHLAEYHARPRGRMRTTRHYKTIENGEIKLRTIHMIDDGESESRHERAMAAAEGQRFARKGTVGRARAVLYDAAPLVRFLARRLAGPELFRTVLRVGGPPPEAR
jgi:aminoglycoside N3'-acetyltransferase